MNERQINALLQALTRQRDSALNAAAQLEAQLELSRAEVVELTAQVARLAAPPPTPLS